MRVVPLLVFAACAVAAVGLYLGFSYFPDQHRIGEAAQIQSAVEKEIHRLEAVSSRLSAVQNEFTQAEARWRAAADFLLPQESVSDFKFWLRTALQRNGIAGSLNFRSVRSHDSYNELPFQLMVSGPSSGFKKFLAQREQEPKGWGFSQLTVFWEDSGLVRATITGAIYIQRPD
jgi:hypothetical protein